MCVRGTLPARQGFESFYPATLTRLAAQLVMFLGACTIGVPLIILNEYMSGGNLEVNSSPVPSPYHSPSILKTLSPISRAATNPLSTRGGDKV